MERSLGPRGLYRNSNRLGQSILYVIYYEYTALYGISNRDGNWLRASRNRRLPAPALALGPLGPEACATVLGYFIARDCAYPSIRDITLDIWGSEWSVMCRHCNSRRGDKTPEQWEIYKLRFKLQSEFAFVN